MKKLIPALLTLLLFIGGIDCYLTWDRGKKIKKIENQIVTVEGSASNLEKKVETLEDERNMLKRAYDTLLKNKLHDEGYTEFIRTITDKIYFYLEQSALYKIELELGKEAALKLEAGYWKDKHDSLKEDRGLAWKALDKYQQDRSESNKMLIGLAKAFIKLSMNSGITGILTKKTYELGLLPDENKVFLHGDLSDIGSRDYKLFTDYNSGLEEEMEKQGRLAFLCDHSGDGIPDLVYRSSEQTSDGEYVWKIRQGRADGYFTQAVPLEKALTNNN